MSLTTCDGGGYGIKIDKLSPTEILIHECWRYGHIWKIIEEPFKYISVCKICGKIGEIKRK